MRDQDQASSYPPAVEAPSAEVPSSEEIVPEVSVVMVAYNAATYLPEAIESVLGQTLRSLELIVVDDGSSDGTVEIAESFAATDDRVRVFSMGSNRGIAPTSNFGIRQARAEFVGRLDADDIAVPTRFERQVDYLRRHPEVAVVGSTAIHISEEGETLGLSIAGPPDTETFEQLRRDGEVTMVLNGTSMIRRSVFESIGGYDEQFPVAVELDLHSRMAEYGAIVSIEEPLTYYRLHGGSHVHSRFYMGRQVHRFISYREKTTASGGDPMTYTEFIERERRSPPWLRLRIRMADYSMGHYRIAGVAIARHDWSAAASHLFRAFISNPIFVVRRVWERRLSAEARSRLRRTSV